MKPVPLKLQRKLLLIPYVNMFNLPLAYYNCVFAYKHTNPLKFVLVFFSTGILMFALLWLVDLIPIAFLAGVLELLVSYFGMVVMGCRLIALQEELLA